jgi:hypothetical protein
MLIIILRSRAVHYSSSLLGITLLTCAFHVFLSTVFKRSHVVRYESFLSVITLLTCSFHVFLSTVFGRSHVVRYESFLSVITLLTCSFHVFLSTVFGRSHVIHSAFQNLVSQGLICIGNLDMNCCANTRLRFKSDFSVNIGHTRPHIF